MVVQPPIQAKLFNASSNTLSAPWVTWVLSVWNTLSNNNSNQIVLISADSTLYLLTVENDRALTVAVAGTFTGLTSIRIAAEIIFCSPNGSLYSVTVDNDGALIVASYSVTTAVDIYVTVTMSSPDGNTHIISMADDGALQVIS